ncbi:phosphogluconate dehydrogenase (NAD(+)-dependent, decarboxylating) [Hymenobacter jeollabukensis]|uniref:Decarboxylating 6-phosphogluconate dehydrogenase n=1 Tax=Hymenobacter jeollabukensis TaxID=2025313 RepID=A0A5R8WQ05_9BACT|nr:decarboxylating 6-phosphogluconate dehydrogenase [Hymenobacter jeollabukensis]TLM91853.1 decarboxylating 6-phosphogluconate dehydrogenase [Hymenobacter jeollabukensis]
MSNTQIGIVGLGKMGAALAQQAAEKGYPVVGMDLRPRPDLESDLIDIVPTLLELAQRLQRPRKVFLYIPAGAAVDGIIEQLLAVLEPGDIIVDGGNSYWGDSIRRAKRLQERGIHFLDCGTSGGPGGARTGACYMVGGDADAVALLRDFFVATAVPDGFLHTGPAGTGHYVKLVHNGIEFGMLQAIAEGMGLLTHFREKLDISAILQLWNNGSVVRSWLIELMKKTYDQEGGFTVPSYIEDTGEVNWLVADALHMEVPIPVITQSVVQLFTSRDKDPTWAKAIAMMRHGFGGHPYGEDAGIRHERQFGRVGEYEQPEETGEQPENNPK